MRLFVNLFFLVVEELKATLKQTSIHLLQMTSHIPLIQVFVSNILPKIITKKTTQL
jgi:hypothetical protein